MWFRKITYLNFISGVLNQLVFHLFGMVKYYIVYEPKGAWEWKVLVGPLKLRVKKHKNFA